MRVSVYVLGARILTNETNKFALARMRTCWWKFPDSRESSRARARSHAQKNGFLSAYVIKRVTDNWLGNVISEMEWKKVA